MLTFLGGERDGQDYYEIIPLSIIVTQDLVVTVRIQNTVYSTPYANSPSSANQTTASEPTGWDMKDGPGVEGLAVHGAVRFRGRR